MANNTRKEIRVGAMIALGLVIIFSAFFIIGGKDGLFSKRYKLYARFDNIQGLTIGAPVRLGGWKVGTVNSIEFTDDAKGEAIIIMMTIDYKSFIRIREDSRARLGSMGLLGDRTLDISLGSPEFRPLAPGEFIPVQSGDVIKDVEAIASNAKEISQKINEGDGSFSKIINDPRLYTNIDSLLLIWTDISNKINMGEGNVAKLFNDPKLYNNVNLFLKKSNELMDNVNAGQGTLGKLATDDKLYTHTDSLLAQLNTTLEKINSGEGTMGQLMVNQDLYMKLDKTLGSLDSLLIDLRENPGRYVKLSLF